MAQPLLVGGVRFFNSAPLCISDFERFSWRHKALSIIQSFGRMLTVSFWKKIFKIKCNQLDPSIHPHTTLSPACQAKKKLIVCLHGLSNNPNQFTEILSELKKDNLTDTEIFVPKILNKGHAKLNDLVQPIFKEIDDWSRIKGEKEIVLIGISNGARIARAIDSKLTQNPGNIKKIRFVSIVGATKGSSLVDFAHKIHLAWLLSRPMAEEMSTYSPCSKDLNKDLETLSSSPLIRDYTFIAAPHDWLVPNYSSTLMHINRVKARYALIPGCGHGGIEVVIATTVAKLISL